MLVTPTRLTQEIVPPMPREYTRLPVHERFWPKVDKTGPIIVADETWPPNAPDPPGTPCWVWTAHVSKSGYGRFGAESRPIRIEYAHRWAYEQGHGPIPKGLEADHLCRNPPCVRQDHIELVTHAENDRRGRSANAAKSHCKYGHEFTTRNTYRLKNGRARGCRECHLAAMRRQERRRASL